MRTSGKYFSTSCSSVALPALIRRRLGHWPFTAGLAPFTGGFAAGRFRRARCRETQRRVFLIIKGLGLWNSSRLHQCTHGNRGLLPGIDCFVVSFRGAQPRVRFLADALPVDGEHETCPDSGGWILKFFRKFRSSLSQFSTAVYKLLTRPLERCLEIRHSVLFADETHGSVSPATYFY